MTTTFEMSAKPIITADKITAWLVSQGINMTGKTIHVESMGNKIIKLVINGATLNASQKTQIQTKFPELDSVTDS